MDSLPPFSGHAADWEDWHDRAMPFLRRSVYAICLDSLPTNEEQRQWDKELYYLLHLALLEGTGFHLVVSTKNECGYSAWKTITDWYSAFEWFYAARHRKRLETIQLDTRHVSAAEYINVFLLGFDKLAKYGEGLSERTRKRLFLNGIVDENYQHIQQSHGSDKYVLDDVIKEVHYTEQRLFLQSESDKMKAPQARCGKDGAPQRADSIPPFPNVLLQHAETTPGLKQTLIQWRRVYNAEQRHITADEVPELVGISDSAGGGSESGDDCQTRKNSSKKRKITRN